MANQQTAKAPYIWALGAGNMGGAVIRRLLDTDLSPEKILIIDRNPRAVEIFGARGVTIVPDISLATGKPDVVMLGIKPQQFRETAPQITRAINASLGDCASVTVLSLMAGVSVKALGALGDSHNIVRAMPNTPCLIGSGVTALFEPKHNAQIRRQIEMLVAPLGQYYWCDAESKLHDATAITGSGPAYVYVFMKALFEAALKLGFPEAQARNMTLQTVLGAAQVAQVTDKDFGMLADEVTSPAGTTRAARDVLDNRLMELLIHATEANKARSLELEKEAENKA